LFTFAYYEVDKQKKHGMACLVIIHHVELEELQELQELQEL